MAETRTVYKDQLPKFNKFFSAESIFALFAGIASIFSFLLPMLFEENSRILIRDVFLITIILCMICYVLAKERKKLHRYSESVLFVHYINHIMRDYFAELQSGKPSDLNKTVEEILTSIANCFSIVTGKLCRCSLKGLQPDSTGTKFEVVTFSRDSMSKDLQYKTVSTEKKDTKHFLDENTDFKNVWYSIEGCSRYFINNNLLSLWKERKYENSSFKIHGEPKVKSVFNYQLMLKWPISYKSTIVWPVRYIAEFTPPPFDLTTRVKKAPKHWHVWGFLCIDSTSKRVFDYIYCPELGGAFADMLYIFLTQTDYITTKAMKSLAPKEKRAHERTICGSGRK